MKDNRPAIPAEIKRKVLVEAGHRCSIPTCRQIICEVHHINEYSEVKEHKYENLICLCSNCHTLVHQGKIDKKSLRMYKHNLGLLHDKYTQFEIDLMFDLYKLPNDHYFYFADFMYYLIRRTTESGLLNIIERQTHMVSGPIQLSFLFVKITETGRDFINNLSNE